MYFEHNIEIYNKFEPIILEHHECCVVSTMGTGKTDISIEFIKKYNLNALIIIPNNSLADQWVQIAGLNGIITINTITYHMFAKTYSSLHGFDCYIFDEAHHMDSPVWGKAIRNFRKNINPNAYVVGLTGDPIRYFDEYKDISQTMFNNHAVYGHTQYEAILQGILPQVIYVCAVYNTDELYDTYCEKVTTEELKGKLDFVHKNSMKITDILRYHAFEDTKGITFVEKIKSISDGIDLIKRTFSDQRVYYAHSELSKYEIDSNINSFRKDKTGLMVAVNIFNEGHHVSGVNTIIMLRKTWSPTIYNQQIGRGMSANHNGKTIIFDFVGNKESVKDIREHVEAIKRLLELKNKESKKYGSSLSDNLSNQVIIYDYTKDYLDVLEEIDEVWWGRDAWSLEEDNFLKENYNNGEGLDLCVEKLNRTRLACQKRARRLGLIYKKKKPWTKEEDDILIKYYPILGSDVVDMIPNRSRRSCVARANNYLGIISNKNVKKPHKTRDDLWTKEEDEILQKYYPFIGMEVSEMLDRSPSAIKSRAHRLEIIMSQ